MSTLLPPAPSGQTHGPWPPPDCPTPSSTSLPYSALVSSAPTSESQVISHFVSSIYPLIIAGIAHVDFPGLRAKGFNAVVVDKDNCLVRQPTPRLTVLLLIERKTLPDRDELFPPLKVGGSTSNAGES